MGHVAAAGAGSRRLAQREWERFHAHKQGVAAARAEGGVSAQETARQRIKRAWEAAGCEAKIELGITSPDGKENYVAACLLPPSAHRTIERVTLLRAAQSAPTVCLLARPSSLMVSLLRLAR